MASKKPKHVDISDVVGKQPGPGERLLPDEALGGEDWGDGFRVREEPVVISRDAAGEISKIERLTESKMDQILTAAAAKPAVEAPPVSVSRPLSLKQREALIGILADRFFRWYESKLDDPTLLNPLRDGIPVCPRHRKGCVHDCKDAQRKYVSQGEAYLWLKAFVADKAEIINKRNNWGGYSPTLTLTRNKTG